MLSLRVDPWAAEYSGALQLDLDEPEAPCKVKLDVEEVQWAPLTPSPPELRPVIYFIDGVRRVDVRVLAETDAGLVYGLFGSVGVGAVRAEAGRAVFVEPLRVRRFYVLGGGASGPDLRVSMNSQELLYEAASVAENNPLAPLKRLQDCMREEEGALGGALAGEDGAVVVADGPVSFTASARSPAVGFVKRIHRRYLPEPQQSVLQRLAPGQRTPLFLLEEGRFERYSWYQRLAHPGPLDYSLAGVVRLEAPTSLGFERVQALADLLTAHLPLFASSRQRDPRAPQNLYPLGALEDFLRHRLGDARWVRRAIEMHLLLLYTR